MNWAYYYLPLLILLLPGYYLTTTSLSLHSTTMLMKQLCWLGFDTDGLMPAVWKGGETEAMTRLERHLERKAWVASFGRPKMTPQSLLASQTGLSPYLRFGCLSVRLFHQQLTSLYKKVNIILRHPFKNDLMITNGICCSDQESPSAALTARPGVVARILLLCSNQQSKFRSDGRKSHLRSNSVGHQRWSVS